MSFKELNQQLNKFNYSLKLYGSKILIFKNNGMGIKNYATAVGVITPIDSGLLTTNSAYGFCRYSIKRPISDKALLLLNHFAEQNNW